MAVPPFDRRRLKEVFAEVRALPASDRQAYLSAACAGNEALRQEVESLLLSDDRAKSFLESPARSRTIAERARLSPGPTRAPPWLPIFRALSPRDRVPG